MRTSLVMPTWNAGPLLDEVLESVLALRGTRFDELCAVDSGSTDGTQERLRDAGVFGAELLPGVRGGASERARGVEVVLGRQVKGFTFSPGSEPAWFGPLFAAGDSLRVSIGGVGGCSVRFV